MNRKAIIHISTLMSYHDGLDFVRIPSKMEPEKEEHENER